MSIDSVNTPSLVPVLERPVLARFFLGVFVLVAGVALLGWAFRAPISALAAHFVGQFGIIGVLLGMLVVDSYAFPPLAHEPILFFAHAGGLGFFEVTLMAGTGSFLAGPTGYLIGFLLSRCRWVERQLRRTGVASVMRRRGVFVVAIAAVSPVPFSASSYAAGALRVPFGPFLLACSLRYPKVALYLGMIAFGWSLG